MHHIFFFRPWFHFFFFTAHSANARERRGDGFNRYDSDTFRSFILALLIRAATWFAHKIPLGAPYVRPAEARFRTSSMWAGKSDVMYVRLNFHIQKRFTLKKPAIRLIRTAAKFAATVARIRDILTATVISDVFARILPRHFRGRESLISRISAPVSTAPAQ